MAVRAVFAAAAALALGIALLLPVPHARHDKPEAVSSIPTLEVGRG